MVCEFLSINIFWWVRISLLNLQTILICVSVSLRNSAISSFSTEPLLSWLLPDNISVDINKATSLQPFANILVFAVFIAHHAKWLKYTITVLASVHAWNFSITQSQVVVFITYLPSKPDVHASFKDLIFFLSWLMSYHIALTCQIWPYFSLCKHLFRYPIQQKLLNKRIYFCYEHA